MQAQSGKFCESCQRYNEPKAVACVYCGAPLKNTNNRPLGTSQIGAPDLSSHKSDRKRALPVQAAPEAGIALYFADDDQPFAISTADQFIMGRKVDDSPEKIIDLSDYDAFGHGVSRRHARVQRTYDGYEITDLGSTNGTWVDDQRLSPGVAHAFASGVLLRLGRMRIYALYRKPAK